MKVLSEKAQVALSFIFNFYTSNFQIWVCCQNCEQILCRRRLLLLMADGRHYMHFYLPSIHRLPTYVEVEVPDKCTK